MGYYDYYPPYVTVAEKRAKARKKLEKLKKKQPDIQPVEIDGRAIAKTWWGKAWNKNLERYADYSNRIGRGRSYVRHGMVLDLKIEAGSVSALVLGTASRPYSVRIEIARISDVTWKEIRQACQGRFDSMSKLLAGKFPKSIGEILTEKGRGLFPSPAEIRMGCSCPDSARMCKHIAAVLYGIGARLDEDPLLFFKLREADVEELVSRTLEEGKNRLLDKAGQASDRVLAETDLSAMFGIDLDDSEAEPDSEKAKKAVRKRKSAGDKPIRKTVKKNGIGKKAAVAKPNAERKKAADKKPSPAPAVKKQTTARKSPGFSAKPAKKTPAYFVEAIIRLSGGDGIDISSIAERTGYERQTVNNAIFRLKKDGKIENVARGVYKSV